ncbi:hypothetical protein K504DRAFT_496092 [Pleomassaria siparia CBS 279.74]|uniref:Uncharacterized protein n=1 Tax=Pleomassaria siparia CBS 279.74 TaxID=1314801 RepID=A0A6G1JQF7_9PLEO|nr:hypothetical protein K504DRAFT_496092 [Pleomassaria siparia CBS 279.74]
MSRTTAHSSSTGISILSPNSTVNAHFDNTVADLVFVHDLNHHTQHDGDTESSSFLRLPDLLPNHLPVARILTFSYNATLVDDKIDARLSEWAENLLGELHASRSTTDEKQRPLIFVCHGFGGQVTKKAMINAHLDVSYKFLEICTTGIVFIATQHSLSLGTDVHSKALPFVSTVASSERATDGSSIPRVLEAINLEFESILEPSRIVSLYEKLQKYGDSVMEELPIASDNPSKQIQNKLNRWHQEMCQFEDRSSTGYREVLEQLTLLMHEARPSTTARLAKYLDKTKAEVLPMVPGQKRRPSSDGVKHTEHAESKRQRKPADAQRSDISDEILLQYNLPHFASHAYYPKSMSLDHNYTRVAGKSLDAALRRVRIGLESPNRSFGIHGLGGVGKTQLALRYISEFSDRYRQVIWLSADQTTKLNFAFDELARRLRLAPDSKPSLPESILLVRDWLSSNTNYLLVYDSADDPEVIQPFLPSIKGSLLITSRSDHFVAERIVAGGLELLTLGPEDGARYLLSKLDSPMEDDLDDLDDDLEVEHAGKEFKKISISKYTAQNPANMESARNISRMFGGHPLALSHMASWIRTDGCSLDQFLEEYTRHRDTIDIRYDAPGASFDYQWSYKSCWDFSFSQLKDSSAERLLGILSLLDADKIPAQLLRDYAKSNLTDIVPLESDDEYRLALVALRNHALVKRDERVGTLSVHRLVQNATVRKLQAAAKIQQAFEDTIRCLSRQFPRQKQGHSMEDDHDQCRLYTPQLLAVEKTYKYLTGTGATENGRIPIGFSLFAELLCHCGWYLYETAQSNVALATLQTARAICDSEESGVEPRLKGLIYSNIGVVLSALNQAQRGLDISKQALNIRLKYLPPRDPQIGESLNNCAGCLHDLNQLDEAQGLFQDSVDLQEESHIRNENLLEGAYSNLGRNCMAMQRLQEADEAFNRARSYHKTCTSGAFFVSLTIFLIGNLRMYQKRWEEAEEEHQTALQMRLQSLGPIHRLTGVSYHQVGRLLHRRGIDHGQDPPGAIEMLRKALESFKTDPAEPGLAPRTKLLLSSILSKVSARTHNAELSAESQTLKEEAANALRSEPDLAGLPYETETEWAMLVQYEYR